MRFSKRQTDAAKMDAAPTFVDEGAAHLERALEAHAGGVSAVAVIPGRRQDRLGRQGLHAARLDPVGVMKRLLVTRALFAALVVLLSTQTVLAASVPVVSHGSRTSKTIALTFDDGWNVPGCTRIVKTLKAEKVTATFFPNGMYVRETPTFWRWLSAKGFPIGNHTTTHHDLRVFSRAEVKQEAQGATRIGETAIGKPLIAAIRPPYGAYDSTVLAGFADAGYKVAVLWDVDSMDSQGVPSVAQEVSYATRGTRGSIILMHCGSAYTPAALPQIIDTYKARGYTFVTIPQMFPAAAPFGTLWTPAPVPATDAPTSQAVPAETRSSFNPALAYDAMGTQYLTYETPGGIAFATNSGAGWSAAEIVASAGKATFLSRPNIAVSADGKVFIEFLSLSASGAQVQVRTRTGTTWGVIETVANLDAPASTASIAVNNAGQPVVTWVRTESSPTGLWIATRRTSGWKASWIPGTDGTWLNPSVAVDPAGKIHVFARRNGRPAISEVNDVIGSWHVVSKLFELKTSAVTAAAYASDGTLYVAAQPTNSPNIRLVTPGVAPARGTIIVTEGDLGGIAVDPGGAPHVVFAKMTTPAVSHIFVAAP